MVCDETHKVKQKLTQIAVLKGEETKALNRARKDWFVMSYSGGRMNFFKVETVEDKIVGEEKKESDANTTQK